MHGSTLFNILVSLVFLLVGLIIHFFSRPPIFEQHPYTRYAFQLWVLRFWIFAFEYTLFPSLDNGAIFRFFSLGIVDLGNMVTLGFCLSFLRGKELGAKGLTLLFSGFCGLIVWNVLFINSRQLGSGWFPDPAWITASVIVAASTTGFIAVVFWFRYRAFAIPLICAQVFQLALQIPAYRAIFLSLSCGACLEWLAWGKIFSGSFSYMMFFVSVPTANFQMIELPLKPIKTFTSGRLVKSVFVLRTLYVVTYILIGFLIHIIGSLLYEHLQWFSHHLPLSLLVLSVSLFAVVLLFSFITKRMEEFSTKKQSNKQREDKGDSHKQPEEQKPQKDAKKKAKGWSANGPQ